MMKVSNKRLKDDFLLKLTKKDALIW